MSVMVRKVLAVLVVVLVLVIAVVAVLTFQEDQEQWIRIDGNEDLRNEASQRGWQGDGSTSKPYIISVEMNTTGTEPCLMLSNTDLYVTVVDCDLSHRLDGQGAITGIGVLLSNVTHVVIQNNVIDSMLHGIRIVSCTDVQIINNKVDANIAGLEIIRSNGNMISRNTIGQAGALNCTRSDNNHFQNNSFSGIGSNTLFSSNHNKFENNTFTGIEGSGLYLENCTFNEFRNNTFQGEPLGAGGTRGMVGLVLQGSSNNSFCTDRLAGGAYMSIGASFIDSSNNSISRCVLIGRTGLYMTGSDDNDVCGSTFPSGVSTAFDMRDSNHNDLSGNLMEESNYSVTGIRMVDCDSNLMTLNELSGRSSSGYIIFLSNCSDNRAFNNSFTYLGAEERAISLGLDDTNLNQWNDSITGNHWSDWTAPDDDSDGFVDIPYELDGNAEATDWRPKA